MARICLHLYQRTVMDKPKNVGALLDALERDALAGQLSWPVDALEASALLTERAEINAALAQPLTTGGQATN
jgi:hypothetical protein